MKILHRPVWESMVSSLDDIFVQGRAADKVIQFRLRQGKKWGSQDRRLFAEGVYDLVRWWRRLLWVCDVPWPESDRWEAADRKIFQRALEAWCRIHEVNLGKGIHEELDPGLNVMARWKEPKMSRCERESIPNWLDNWGQNELGNRWEDQLAVLNSAPPVFLRANTIKTSVQQLVGELKAEKIEAEPVSADCVRLLKRANVFLTKAFRQGHFEVQDLHSQKISCELQVEPGMKVIDACAGAGGKSLHLAALMKNKGRINSLDVHQRKLDELRERAARDGVDIVETRLIEGSKVIKRLGDTADRVLLDVPCSGMGVLRRNPDSKWKLSRDEIQRLNDLQLKILSEYSRMCKAGGKIVYATCSIMPSENIKVIEQFISQNETSFKLEDCQTLWPEQNGGDGFFWARLVRS